MQTAAVFDKAEIGDSQRRIWPFYSEILEERCCWMIWPLLAPDSAEVYARAWKDRVRIVWIQPPGNVAPFGIGQTAAEFNAEEAAIQSQGQE